MTPEPLEVVGEAAATGMSDFLTAIVTYVVPGLFLLAIAAALVIAGVSAIRARRNRPS